MSEGRPAAANLPLLFAVALLAAAALAYQLLLMRLLAVVHWYPFAAIIVSLALLGHGASGSLLSLCAQWARRRYRGLFVLAAAGFGLGAPLAFALAQRLPFNGLELIWDPWQLAHFSALYLLLALPFGCAAAGFGLVFLGEGTRIPRYYAADLAGAGLGAVLAVLLMYALPLEQGLRVVGVAGLLAAALALRGAGLSRRAPAGLLAAALAVLLLPSAWLAPQPNPYKGLSRTLLVPGTQLIAETSSPLGWLQVIESPQVPLRHAPGLSLYASREPPSQLGLFVDGDGPAAITRRDDPAALDYLQQSLSALPYRLLSSPRVLVLAAGTGGEVLQALERGAAEVHAVERDPQLAALVAERFADFAGHLYADPRVRLSIGDARRALARATDPYDLIIWPGGDSAGAAGGGVHAAADNFVDTVEALRAGHRRLAPGGLLALGGWEQTPPRAVLKRLASVVAAWRAEGVREPAAHLALVRGWQTHLLIAARDPLRPDQLAAVRDFATDLGFEPVLLPGADATLATDASTEEHALHAAVHALLGPQHAAFVRDYAFAIAPASDDRPFFHNFFRWRSLPELWRQHATGGAALLDSGYLLLAGALAQAVPLSLLLILLPLAALPRAPTRVGRSAAALYFLCLGLGFLFVEIAALSRHSHYLGDPLLAATLVLAALLVFAGVGSACAQHWQQRSGLRRLAPLAVAAGVLATELVQPLVFAASADWALPARALVATVLLAPLAFVMGLPFPLGLARLARETPAFVPWAWGINGFASVISALLALLLAIAFGYGVVMLLAAALYVLAAAVWR